MNIACNESSLQTYINNISPAYIRLPLLVFGAGGGGMYTRKLEYRHARREQEFHKRDLIGKIKTRDST